MKGDFSRMTFDVGKHFSRVLMQQGRVQLDTDWNEQTSILLHYLQTLAKDLIGDHAGPADIVDDQNNVLRKNLGFELIVDAKRIEQFLELDSDGKQKEQLQELLKKSNPPILIGKGRYYIDGMLCEIDDYFPFASQPDYSLGKESNLANAIYLVYADVWERHITYIEDDYIREVALGGADTATRAKVVWQIKTENKTADGENDIPNEAPEGFDTLREWVNSEWSAWVNKWQPINRGLLKARAKQDQKKDTDPCIISPEASYRGTENQLYRIEIHQGGKPTDNLNPKPTFKWSRDNGTATFPIRRLSTNSDSKTTTVELEHLGRDDYYGLTEGNWVEIQDDASVGQDLVKPLLKVIAIDRTMMTVTLSGLADSDTGQDTAKHPLLRRWDHKAGAKNQSDVPVLAEDGALALVEGQWLVLENGVQIYFEKSEGTDYRTGDYWVIPARMATGDVEWRGPVGDPEARAPHGIEHHYAPLAIIAVTNGSVKLETELRNVIKPSAIPL